MDRVYSALTALLVGVAALMAGQGALNTTVALALEASSAPGWALASVLAAYFVGWVVGCLSVPRLLRRVGHIRTFAALAGTTCAATLLYSLVPPPLPWLALRIASGFCVAGLLLTVENWITLHAPGDRRGGVLSVYLLVFYGALGGGQFLLGLTGFRGYPPYVVSALLLALATVPIAATRSAAPTMPESEWMSPLRLVRLARTTMVAAFVSGVLVGGSQTLGPIFVRRVGLDAAGAGHWMGAMILGGLVLQWPVGWLSDRWDRRALILIVCLLLVGVSAGFVWYGQGLASLLLLGAAFGSLVALIYPLALTHGSDRVSAADRLGLGSLLVLVAGLGSLLGPILATCCMALLGPTGLFELFGACAAALALVTLANMLRRAAPSAAQSQSYVPVPRTTAAVGQLDPRVPEEQIMQPADD